MIKFLTLSVLKIFDTIYQKKFIKFLHERGYQKFDTFFDVGAHHGESIFLFSKHFKINKIYSFEPIKSNFDKLKINLSKSNLKNENIFLENLGLGDKNKTLVMKQLKESSSSTINDINISSKYFKKKSFFLFGKSKNFFSETQIKQITLFDYINDKKIKQIDFLKIDTEGYELNILAGLEKNFSKVSVVMFEHHYHDMILKKYKFSDIHSLLINNNFKQIFKSKMPFRKTFEYIYEKIS